jgi:transposase InsO family protein
MPKAQGYKYIVAARDDLSQAAEGRALKAANSATISKFLWEEIFCRYGAIGMVVTDNGPEVQKVFEHLMEKYGIPQVKISPYNSRANGVVERGHYIIREALIKACEGKINRWPNLVHHAFFADKIMPRKATGFSPFYLLYGIDPVLPFDLDEVTYLVDGFYAGMATEDLLALRIRQLEKKPSDLAKAAKSIIAQRMKHKAQFEKKYNRLLRREDYNPGDLVIVQNSSTFKSHNRKHKARYLGPMEVDRKTLGGSYVLKDLNGAVNRRGVAAYRLLPYYPRGDLWLDRIEKVGEDGDVSEQGSENHSGNNSIYSDEEE